MIKEAIGTGETVIEAQEAACKELGVETHEAEFEILQMPEKKVFGLFGGSEAKVRAYLPVQPVDAAAKYLEEVLEKMGISGITMKINEVEKGAEIDLEGEDVGSIIGRRGETLDALQYLTGLVANHVDNSYYRITINIGNYRKKREKTLEILGRKLAIKSSKTGMKNHLEPMNPYERRIIHTAVQGITGAISWSEGENAARHVVIGPDPEVKQTFRRNNGGYRNNDRNGDRNGGRRPYNNNNRSGNYNNRNNNYNRPNNNKPAQDKTDRKPINEGGEMGLYGRIDK